MTTDIQQKKRHTANVRSQQDSVLAVMFQENQKYTDKKMDGLSVQLKEVFALIHENRNHATQSTKETSDRIAKLEGIVETNKTTLSAINTQYGEHNGILNDLSEDVSLVKHSVDNMIDRFDTFEQRVRHLEHIAFYVYALGFVLFGVGCLLMWLYKNPDVITDFVNTDRSIPRAVYVPDMPIINEQYIALSIRNNNI